MTALLRRVAEIGLLRSSWGDVLANDREDGGLGAGVARFAEDAEARLQGIAAELAAGTFAPGLLTRVDLPREDGTSRLLHVPKVSDRVVERAVLAVLTPIVDPWLGPWSFAYRAAWVWPTRCRRWPGCVGRAWTGWSAPMSPTASPASRSVTCGA